MDGWEFLARTPCPNLSPQLISSSASAAPPGGPTFLCHPSTSRWALSAEVWGLEVQMVEVGGVSRRRGWKSGR